MLVSAALHIGAEIIAIEMFLRIQRSLSGSFVDLIVIYSLLPSDMIIEAGIFTTEILLGVHTTLYGIFAVTIKHGR